MLLTRIVIVVNQKKRANSKKKTIEGDKKKKKNWTGWRTCWRWRCWCWRRRRPHRAGRWPTSPATTDATPGANCCRGPTATAKKKQNKQTHKTQPKPNNHKTVSNHKGIINFRWNAKDTSTQLPMDVKLKKTRSMERIDSVASTKHSFWHQ